MKFCEVCGVEMRPKSAAELKECPDCTTKCPKESERCPACDHKFVIITKKPDVVTNEGKRDFNFKNINKVIF